MAMLRIPELNVISFLEMPQLDARYSYFTMRARLSGEVHDYSFTMIPLNPNHLLILSSPQAAKDLLFADIKESGSFVGSSPLRMATLVYPGEIRDNPWPVVDRQLGMNSQSCSPRDGCNLLVLARRLSRQPVFHFFYCALCGSDSTTSRRYWSFGICIGEEDSVQWQPDQWLGLCKQTRSRHIHGMATPVDVYLHRI